MARGLTHNGVRQFVINTLRGFQELQSSSQDDFEIIVFTDDESMISEFSDFSVVYIPSFNKILWDYVRFPIKAVKYDIDVMVYTKNVIPITHLMCQWQKLLVIYDLGYFYPELSAYRFWDTLYMKIFMRISSHLADHIMAISAFTKSEIVKFFGTDAEKITVNHLGVKTNFQPVTDEKRLENLKNRFGITNPFFIYVGSLSPRKNIYRAVAAFESIKDEISQDFILVSGRNWGEEAEKIYQHVMERLPHRAYVYDHVIEEDLIALYSLSDALIYPSLYEGFGLPVIEAAACGTQVITSDRGSTAEVGGEFAILVDPEDIHSIAKSMKEVADSSQSYRSDYIDLKLKKFRWKSTAKKIICLSCKYV